LSANKDRRVILRQKKELLREDLLLDEEAANREAKRFIKKFEDGEELLSHLQDDKDVDTV